MDRTLLNKRKLTKFAGIIFTF